MSLDSSATVTLVAVVAVPVTSPVTLPVSDPLKVVADRVPFDASYVNALASVLGARSPVASVTNNGKQVVSLDSSTTTTLLAPPEMLTSLNATNSTISSTVAPVVNVTVVPFDAVNSVLSSLVPFIKTST